MARGDSRQPDGESVDLNGSLFCASLQGAPFGAIVAATERGGPCVYINDEFTNITGYSLDDMPTVDDWILKAYPDPEYRQWVLAHWDEDVDPANMHRDVIYRVTCRNGTERRIQFRASRLPSGLMFVMLLDVTAREATLQELRVRNQAMESCAEAICFANLDLELTYANPAYAELWGYGTVTQVIGRSAYEFWSDPEDIVEGWSEVLKTGRWSGELLARRADGTRFPVWVSASVACDAEGNPLCVMAWFMDLSAQRQAEELLIASQAQLRAAIESVPYSFTAIGKDGRYTLQNSVCRHHWGDIIGKRPEELGADEDTLAFWLEINRRAFAGETVTVEGECSIRGESRLLHTSVSPIETDRGIEGIVSVCIDISARRDAENERRELEERLHQSQRVQAIGQLAGGVAHDFNNILTAIIGNADLLLATAEEGSEDAELLTEITRAGTQAADMTGKLLTFARKGAMRPLPVDVHVALRHVERLLTRAIDRRISIVMKLDATRHTVLGDSTQIQTTFLNLGLNARDAIDAAGCIEFATGDVTLRTPDPRLQELGIPPGTYMEIRVSDTGRGIPAEHLPQIFEPFFTTKAPGEGTGLGLVSAHGSVAAHKGHIRVESTLGAGTTFTVLLPVNETIVTPAVVAADPPGRDAVGHILIVDDERAVRDYAARVLKRLGYDVTLCSDGAEALSLCETDPKRFDLILLDLVMPKINGETVFREWKDAYPEVRILLSSGYDRGQCVENLLAEGASGFLAKPYIANALAVEVSRCLT